VARKVAKVDVVSQDVEQPSVPITETKPAGGRGLGIQVDDQDAVPLLTQGRGEVDRGRSLPAAALSVADRNSLVVLLICEF
jgi:hypothetical protein